jgi:hypothetical protein
LTMRLTSPESSDSSIFGLDGHGTALATLWRRRYRASRTCSGPAVRRASDPGVTNGRREAAQG